jgi:hypothetical protein
MGLPSLPQIRNIAGAIGNSIDEIRQFLQALKNIKLLSGTEVTVTFVSADISGGVVKRVVTGLGYPPTGYFVIRGHKFSDVTTAPFPATETDKTVLYLSASTASTYTLWVF